MVNKPMWTVVCVVSLALNLLIVGIFLGRWYVASSSAPLAWAVRDLPEVTRAHVRDVLRSERGNRREARRIARDAMDRVRQIALTEPFDEDATRRALADLRQVQDNFHRHVHESMVVLLAQLPSEQRRLVVDGLLESRRPRDRR
jgi:uncharacterized membrane protein